MQGRKGFRHLSDGQLVSELTTLAQDERRATTALVACLEEFDRRRLYLGQGFSSTYAYCRARLHLSDDATYKRIEVARASRRYPELLEMLDDGRLSLTTACLIVQRVPGAAATALIASAAFKSKREVDLLIAAQQPQPPVPSLVRKLPQLKATSHMEVAVPVRPSLTEGLGPGRENVSARTIVLPPVRQHVVAPLSAQHYKLQVTISASTRERLTAIQDLMRHRLPSGDPAAIIARALEVLHAHLLKQKAAIVAKPRSQANTTGSTGRHIPASVKRAVFRRDEGQCAFVAPDGRKCGSRSAVEFHHVDPYAHGGPPTIANIELRCRAHNGFEWALNVERAGP
jgi:5-methylcytosine-specific restriction endonuclease McrA